MTREEAVEYFKQHIDLYCVEGICREAEEMAIKALQQEPCGKDINVLVTDTISREELKKMFREKCVADCSCCKYFRGDDWCEIINDAPSVQPKQKTGTWRKDIDNSRRWDRVRFYCSGCGSWQTYGETDYCPSCGAKMERSGE